MEKDKHGHQKEEKVKGGLFNCSLDGSSDEADSTAAADAVLWNWTWS